MSGTPISTPPTPSFTPSRFDMSLMWTDDNYQYLAKSVWQDSLYEFLKGVWPVIEPGRPFYGGFHIQAICDHLEAVTRGDIRKLLINVPPRSTKSTILSKVWPCWIWTTRPEHRFLATTYSDTLVTRDAIAMRDVADSHWYQGMWGDVVVPKSDQWNVHFFRNLAGGYRISTTPGGAGTGHGGDSIMCFPYETKVMTTQGPMDIGSIVEQRLKIDVPCLDVKTGAQHIRPVIDWKKNPAKPLITVDHEGGRFTSTVDHKIWTVNRGWVEAQNLRQGDELRSLQPVSNVTVTKTIPHRILPPNTYCITVDEFHTLFVNDSPEGDFVASQNCDDAHSVKEMEHPNQIKKRVNWWANEMSTRFENANTCSWVVSGQRICIGDISDWCIEVGYEHLMIPMDWDDQNNMYQKSPRCIVTSIGWTDPRRPGQPLEGQIAMCPERFPPEIVNGMKLALRINANAQLQQDPSPGEGGIFDITKFADRIVDATPAIGKRVRYWDRAFTEEDGAHTVGLLLNISGGLTYIEDVKRKQMSPAKRNRYIKLVAMRDAKITGNTVTIYVEQEPGAGKESAAILLKYLAGYPVFADPARKNKTARAIPVAAQVTAGNVYLLRADWNQPLLDELEYFPNSTFKDQADALSGAYNKAALGDGTVVEGQMIASGGGNDSSPLSPKEIEDLSKSFPEIADIVGALGHDDHPLSHLENDHKLHPTFTSFDQTPPMQPGHEPMNLDRYIDQMSERSSTEATPDTLDDIEAEIAELLEGSDDVIPGEYSTPPAMTEETAPWPI